MTKDVIKKVEDSDGIYVCQHPDEMIALGLNLQTTDQN